MICRRTQQHLQASAVQPKNCTDFKICEWKTFATFFLLSDWNSKSCNLVQILLRYNSGTIVEALGINTIYCEPLLHYLSCCCFVVKDLMISSSAFHHFNFFFFHFLLPKLLGIVLWPKLQELSSVFLLFLWNISNSLAFQFGSPFIFASSCVFSRMPYGIYCL